MGIYMLILMSEGVDVGRQVRMHNIDKEELYDYDWTFDCGRGV
jgi:hypothetical protein